MDLDDLYRLLRSAHVQAQGVVDTISDPLLVMDEEFCILSANPAFYRTFETSRDDTLGKCFLNLGRGEWDKPGLKLLLERVIPKSAAVVNYEVTSDFPKIGARTMLVTAQRLAHPDDGRRLLLLSLVDGSEQKAKDQEAEILLGEVQHRVKNLLAVTKAMARQTRIEGRTAQEYRDAFLGRFDALERALDASIKGRATHLEDLVKAVLEPYLGPPQAIQIETLPAVPLTAQEAMSLGMILHELATNAMKHGSLSQPSGWVSLGARVEDDGAGSARLEMAWDEHGGPQTVPADEPGFGTRLIQYAVNRDLGGHVELNLKPNGLQVSLGFPIGTP